MSRQMCPQRGLLKTHSDIQKSETTANAFFPNIISIICVTIWISKYLGFSQIDFIAAALKPDELLKFV